MSDIKVTLRDKDFALVPTFEALERVEAAAGRSVFDMFQDVVNEKPLKLSEVVSIVLFGAQTFGALPEWWSRSAVGGEVCKQGIFAFYKPAASWLTTACMAAPATKLPVDKSEGDSAKKD
jgi:hypothetical protein